MESIDNGSIEDDDEYEEVAITKPARRPPTSERSFPRKQRTLPPEVEEVYYEERRYERRPHNSYDNRPRPSGKRRNGDWASAEVSSWFSNDDTYVDKLDMENDNGRSRRPRRRAEEEESWSLTSILDGIFGVNREEINMNAAMYNRQMGIDKPERTEHRRRRPGNAYPYVEDEQTTSAEPSKREIDIGIDDVVDVDAVIEDEVETHVSARSRARTIDERAAAFERVPPSGVPAWGPSGAVGVDARTKATLDALEDIREATRKVEQKEEQCINAKEDLVVLKA